MEQFIVIVALIAYFFFRGAARRGQRLPGSESGDAPVSRGGLEDAIEASQQRAVEALRRWEAKQRAAGWIPEEPASAGPSPPSPPATQEAAPRVRLTGRRAERQRREAYADIARMLDPAARETPTVARRGSLRVRAPREPGPTRWAEGADRETRAVEAPRPEGTRRRPERGAAPRPGPAPSAVETRETPVAARRPRRSGAKPGAALGRLERLPLAARAIAYAEILGRPPGLR